jgi:hypothetical protein
VQVNVIESFNSSFSGNGRELALVAGVNPELSSVFVVDERLDADEAARESGGVGVGVVDPDDEAEEEELVAVGGPEVE